MIFAWLPLLAVGMAAAQSVPFLGAPHPIPGSIEIEHYDLGGEGVAFHGAGLVVTNAGETIVFPPGRRGDGISGEPIAFRTYIVLRTGEWIAFSVDAAAEGYYAVALRTTGPPLYVAICGIWEQTFCEVPGTATVHLELDGSDITGPVPLHHEEGIIQSASVQGQVETFIPRVWIPSGRHQLRLVVDAVSDVSHLGLGPYWSSAPWRNFSVGFDWVRLQPAAVPMLPEALAGGGEAGFRDGRGEEARFGWGISVVGEQAAGDLIVQDTDNAAFRIVSREGEVRTLAGHPGNPVRDGVGTNAGFGLIRHAALTAEGFLVVVEEESPEADRVRRVEPDGTVSTLYTGRPEATFSFFSEVDSGRTNQAVALSRVNFSPLGEMEVAGQFYHEEVVPDPYHIHIPPRFESVTRSAYFALAEGNMRQTRVLFGELPPRERQDFGDGFHRGEGLMAGLYFRDAFGAEHDLTPSLLLYSVFRGTDGEFFTVTGRSHFRISRLVPNASASRLGVHVAGGGSVEGVPRALVLPEEDIHLEAISPTRFTRFLGWSDGSQEPSRTFRISRDTFLTASFTNSPPEPNGIIRDRLEVAPDRSLRVGVVGNAIPYHYRVEVSKDLKRWTAPPPTARVLFNSGAISGSSLDARSPETWLSIPYIGERLYLRMELLDQ
ncbi:MAG: hypothetical protein KIT22_12770 [Verrucomicrobiae bacterium]|nr:hypothetical protein [Verrucomicrobiae bacterium]